MATKRTPEEVAAQAERVAAKRARNRLAWAELKAKGGGAWVGCAGGVKAKRDSENPLVEARWRCQAMLEYRGMGQVVGVRCEKHFRHGVEVPGGRVKFWHTRQHKATVGAGGTGGKPAKVKWQGVGEGTVEQEAAWWAEPRVGRRKDGRFGKMDAEGNAVEA